MLGDKQPQAHATAQLAVSNAQEAGLAEKDDCVLSRRVRNATVDGRNPAPVDIENILFFIGFHIQQVVQDFFHQQ